MEFGFFRGLPENLYFLDIAGQVAFLVDVILQFFVAYRDSQTYKMISNRNLMLFVFSLYNQISCHCRYLRSHFVFDLLACMPWDNIYRASGRKEEVRYLLLIRLVRVRKVLEFFSRLEKDIRVNYLFSRIIKLIAVELYCTHTAACIFYYLATTLPAVEEGYTWIGSLKLGDYSYSNFREIDIWKRYTTSLYFAIVTMATVGYGDIHAVNLREMIFVMAYVSFDMVLGAYLIGNMTALIVKGSKTERYRDRMTDLLKYMNRNRLGRDIRNQIKGHLRLQYESSYTDSAVLHDLPISIRAKISQTLYKSYIANVSLFKGCSLEFINQIVTKVHEEFFLPGEVIMEQGKQLSKFISSATEEIGICEDGSEETVSILKPHSSFGEISILCNIPQPYTVRLKSLIRAGADPNKKDYDGRTPLHLAASKGYEDITLFLIQEGVELNVLDNFGNTPLLEAIKSGHDKVASLLVKEGASLKIDDVGCFLCSTVAKGDIDYIRRILSNGIDPNSKDFDFRTPLHVAASQGSYIIVKLLVEAGASVLSKDRWGNTPLDEGRMSGNKMLIKLLEEAKSVQLSELPEGSQEITDKMHPRKCTIYPFHPWEPKEKSGRFGVVVWIPRTIDELVKMAAEQLELQFHPDFCIVTEDAGKIVDVDMIIDDQKLYLITQE
ncbi:hypothetical protein OSB04_000463 [Centaurea solstitialis]|uniref:Potassium channel SKOR-like n=1 Tax=Centaurea solstitialis TaxID=347529 RepID=A0AA38WKJ8_9ASTR|nr:hypothetical protein OSB04_000463 [Centaurea solstitialis]